ncbi:MAG TPA: hypothetical protein VGI28_03475 [Stellaceae bacterium]
MVPRRFDISAEKSFAEAKADSEIEDQRDVGPRLAARRHDSLA